MNSYDFQKQITIEEMVCLIKSNFAGCLCGYVATPSSSPLFGIHYNEDRFPYLDVHGGITFTGAIKSELLACEWSIGFDCAHLGDAYHPDYVKKMGFDYGMREPSYEWRDEDYVTKELERLVRQIKEHSGNNEGVIK